MGWVMLSASFSINPVGIGLGPHVGLIGQRFLTTRSKTKNEPRSVFRQVSTLLFYGRHMHSNLLAYCISSL